MQLARTGIILLSRNFDACVAFYRDLFGLEVLFEKSYGDFRLSCLDFAGAYLLIETDTESDAGGRATSACPHILRVNVDDMEAALKSIRAYGIDAQIEHNAWGDTINVFDPDGNRVGIRDENTFLQ